VQSTDKEIRPVFDQINGLPLHVLVVHAAVVLTPLAALLGLLFALVRPWRWLLRWPLVASAALVVGTVFVAEQSGEAFRDRLGLPPEVIHAHASAGALLLDATIVYLVVCTIAAVALGGPSPLRSGRGGRSGVPAAVQTLVAVVLVIGVLGLSYQVFRTGDSGARAVWGTASTG
jgi:hypothetical protein